MIIGHLIVLAGSIALITACLLLHYETFRLLAAVLFRIHVHRRRQRVLVLIASLLLLHLAEIGLFGLGYALLLLQPETGGIRSHEGTVSALLDLVYFSFVMSSTLGLGDLYAVGPIRFLAALQSLLGFLLITWSASFTFLEMERLWRDDLERPRKHR